MAASTKTSGMQFGKIYRVLEKNNSTDAYGILLEHRYQENNALLFESGAVALLTSEETESIKRQFKKIQDVYGCLGILQISSGDTNLLFLVTVTGCVSVGKINDFEIFRITQTSFLSLRNQSQDEDFVIEIKKLLHSGTFYFCKCSSVIFDLSLCLQRQRKTNETDNRFFWNHTLHIPFLRYGIDTSSWLLKIICGNVEIKTVYIRHRQARAVIISRLSCERVGTRFNVRGCNDDGHVANFVETEQVLFLEDMVTSYLQIRGSVPLFWEQTGVQVGAHKVKMSRGPVASTFAYNKHLSMLKKRYGKQIIINLLNSSPTSNKESEFMLSQMFQYHHTISSHKNDIPFIIFDYHSECRGGNTKNLQKLKDQVEVYVNEFGLFFANADEVIMEQKGTIRTNCLDCLDRTNCTQTFLGIEILLKQLDILCKSESQQIFSRFEEVFRQMWINNGNEISKIYAGTGAIQGGSKLMDGARSAARTIQNNLLDGSKQEAIDIFLLGNSLNSELADMCRMLLPSTMLHASPNILKGVCSDRDNFTFPEQLRIVIGTYNVNGGKYFHNVAFKDINLKDWLLDPIRVRKTTSLVDTFVPSDEEIPADIFAIGFQEIVDLNASNIVAASSEHANLWLEELQKVLSRDCDYVLLTYIQLVGVCLFIFIKPELANYIKDVAVDSVKTGLGGATGNKGAVAIRFVLQSSSLCFVCSHFAAGQSQVSERNADFLEITKKISFPMGRTLNSHDYIFWCGDFNYRVDMDKNTMKDLIKNNNLDVILQYDQLTLQKKENKIFQDYIEGDITFPPTYKYDTFSNEYDTSEKCRAPAWTDRILFKKRQQYGCSKGNPIRLIYYGQAELQQSDHRPVVAILDIDVIRVDEQKRDSVFTNVIKEVGPPDCTIILSLAKTYLHSISSVFDNNFMTNVLQQLSIYGEVVLIRFVDDTMWVTFRDGKSCLAATENSILDVGAYKLDIALKSPNWIEQTMKEINICSDNTIPLYEAFNDLNISDNTEKLYIKNIPLRPPRPVTKPQAGVFSISPNFHQPLKPTIVPSINSQNESKVPIRPAPPVPVAQVGPPPVPQRITPVPIMPTVVPHSSASDVPPPIPARTNLPPK